jgi:hypothetical protein
MLSPSTAAEKAIAHRYSPWAHARRSRRRSAPCRSSAGSPAPASPPSGCGDEVGERVGGEQHHATAKTTATYMISTCRSCRPRSGSNRSRRPCRAAGSGRSPRKGHRRRLLLVEQVAGVGVGSTRGGSRSSPSTSGTAARDQDQVAPREGGLEGGLAVRERAGLMPRSNTGAVSPTIQAIDRQQRQPHHQRQADADSRRLRGAAPRAICSTGSR